MKRIEKEFEQITAFIRARRNGAIGFLNYAALRRRNENKAKWRGETSNRP